MTFPVLQIGRSDIRIAAEDNQIFRVLELRGVSEIKRAGDDRRIGGPSVNHHDFVMRTLMLGIEVGRTA